ncbi:serine/threonine-protein kinase [Streptomyces sp. B-S-A8]|uniref:non-specific serine/threonine protein kinase n=1 Tax=Streptomyces solicavernae TaxID=3043614 RepID=A0ABT6RZU0_9ACTN|nr:serine/threonine-protein kinase [Streptomyces sp. B-S-A8]MDI3389946.1 serine/threonine-protein kinase [Streptomyces sp. B-S-A8]
MASTGDLIAGRYRIAARLGRGGMGTVWRAQDELLGRAVAVKELHVDDGLPSMDAEMQRERTLREARSVAQVRHPNIMVLHDIVEHDAQPWIVMELIDGRSLADRIALEGPVAPAEAARVGLALLDALRAAHASGVQHRDLKPANVLIEARTGRVVLSDFGIAQVAGQTTLTETGSFVGSPEYTAPERMSNRHTGPESDLWSLGVLLCAAVDGESPFHRDSVAGVLHAVVMDEIRIPAAAGPLTPVVRGLLERDVAHRLDVDEAERLLWPLAEDAVTAPLATAGARVAAAAAAAAAPADPRVAHAAAPVAAPPPRRAAGQASRAPGTPQTVPEQAGSPAGPAGPAGPAEPAEPAEPLVASTRPAPPPSRRPRVRTAVLAGALALALAGGGTGFGLWYAGRDGASEAGGEAGQVEVGPTPTADRPRGDRVPDASPNPTASDRAKPTAPTEKERPGNGDGGNAADTPADDGSETPAADPAPAGYRTVTDPLGFKVAVPDGFTRSYEAPRVYYYSPGKKFRLGFHPQPQDPQGPLAVMRQAHEDGPDDYPGYRNGSVTETTHNGHAAALWTFTWDGTAADGGPRKTYDLSWDENGRMYDLWISGPSPQQATAKRHFDVALESFTAGG